MNKATEIKKLISERDEIIDKMNARGDFASWDNSDVNRIQRKIDGIAREIGIF